MSDVVLEFKSVCYTADAEHINAVENSSFRLSAGDMLMVRADADTEHAPILDLGLGLVAPESGTILFEGREWSDMDAFEEAACRGQIGAVFDAPGWVSSLSVIDNIMLRVRHHTKREENDIHDEVANLVSKAGINDSFDIGLRPAVARQRRLRVYEWVRACMGSPALIMMAFPEHGASSRMLEYVLKLTEYMASEGSAVFMMTGSNVISGHAEDSKWQVVNGPDLFGKNDRE
jgi:phospholipid/cholesterol/gamma-HCH transport system ATP-binding protein